MFWMLDSVQNRVNWELRKIEDTVMDSRKTEEIEPADADVYYDDDDVYDDYEQGRI